MDWLRFFTFKNVVALGSASVSVYFSFKKYRDSLKRKNREIYTAPILTHEINKILKGVEQKITTRQVIAVSAELTNGGGIPKFDKPIYIKAINSNHLQTLELWGSQKTKCTPKMIQAISEMYKDSYSSLDISDFKIKLVELWGEVKNIEKVFYFIIGVEGRKRALLLSINSDSSAELTKEEMLIIYDASFRIKNLINKNRKYFWQNKIR